MKLGDLLDITLSIPFKRLNQDTSQTRERIIYNQTHFDNDSIGMTLREEVDEDTIFLDDGETVVHEGDIIIACNTGRAALVHTAHEGYVISMSFMRCTVRPNVSLDAGYLVYLLNEDQDIQRQRRRLGQGSVIVRYTAPQIRNLTLRDIPTLDIQRRIGNIYEKILRLEALRKRVAERKRHMVLETLKGV